MIPARNMCIVSLAIALALAGCARQPPPDLGTGLKGIEKSRFLACSGPPLVAYPQGSQDRMSFLTNLKRGSQMGVAGAAGGGGESCAVDALFENSRLVRANFSGDMAMCQFVFDPCLPR